MQVFQNQHKRPVCCQRLEGYAHLAQHSLLRCSRHFPAQHFAIWSAEQKGHLQQPHRRVTAKHVGDLSVLTTQPPDSFQDRQIGLTCPVVFETLSPCCPKRPIENQVP